MGGISKSACVSLILQYIGGSKLFQIPTTTIMGQPVAIQAGVGGLASAAAGIAMQAASGLTGSIAGIEAGLRAVSQNPLASTIGRVSGTVSSLTSSSFAGLDAALPSISGDVALASSYAMLKDSLGGSDGNSGTVAQLTKFETHTDQLSGLTAGTDSSFLSDESGADTAALRDQPANTDQTIIQFSAAQHQSAKYRVQASGNTSQQVSDVAVLHNGLTATVSETNKINIGNSFVVYTATLTSGTVSLKANSSIPNTHYVVQGTKMEIGSGASINPSISQDRILASAQSLAAFYPDDSTDYIRAQTGSLYNEGQLLELETEINDMLVKLNSPQFAALSTPEKQAYITAIAEGINNRNRALQSSIDSDITAFNDVASRVEIGGAMTTLTAQLTNPAAQQLLNMTLRDDIKGAAR